VKSTPRPARGRRPSSRGGRRARRRHAQGQGELDGQVDKIVKEAFIELHDPPCENLGGSIDSPRQACSIWARHSERDIFGMRAFHRRLHGWAGMKPSRRAGTPRRSATASEYPGYSARQGEVNADVLAAHIAAASRRPTGRGPCRLALVATPAVMARWMATLAAWLEPRSSQFDDQKPSVGAVAEPPVEGAAVRKYRPCSRLPSCPSRARVVSHRGEGLINAVDGNQPRPDQSLFWRRCTRERVVGRYLKILPRHLRHDYGHRGPYTPAQVEADDRQVRGSSGNIPHMRWRYFVIVMN